MSIRTIWILKGNDRRYGMIDKPTDKEIDIQRDKIQRQVGKREKEKERGEQWKIKLKRKDVVYFGLVWFGFLV